MFRVYEIFSSIQGESTFAGVPCFFIRFAGCNLNCRYCDTRKARPFDAGKDMTQEQLVAAAVESGLNLVELTGGEPLMQKNVSALAAELIRLGKTVLMETNGSCDCSVLPPEVHRIIDYKTPCSGEESAMLEQNFRSLRPHDQVKFVIADDTDYECAVRCLKRFDLTAQTPHILFSPAWGSDLRRLTERIVHDKLPVRLNLQFHKIIWGADSEGV